MLCSKGNFQLILKTVLIARRFTQQMIATISNLRNVKIFKFNLHKHYIKNNVLDAIIC
ncbi:hypothetical protein J2W57_003202 [Chryseobacterium ginsenosidimutans]|uniref:DDE family transposase n=1 Tax=Chryseobacterium geocarposphaerae TaxID=1416776 RepID=A0ABU1LCC0_9FLAO|nr:hypothetical protein [Chryseobacterium geocarposphaerae]MDR6699799.1 hypothetical protein [Chryseobacterium ginsenosidimutans]